MRTILALLAVLLSLPLASSCRTAAPAPAAPAVADTTAEEYAIYKLVIEDVCQPNESMPVLDVTVPNHLHDPASDAGYRLVRDSAHATEKATLVDFWSRNQEPAQLDYKLDLVHGNTYITEAQTPRAVTYPGHVELSRIGFNPERTQAVVYCGHVWQTSELFGRAYYLILDKVGGAWAISHKLTTHLHEPAK